MSLMKGFTLLELLVTLAVAAIVTTIAIPSFRTIVISNRLASAANEYVAALSEAKLEAVRRNRASLLCGSSGNITPTLGAACAGAGSVVATTSGSNADLVRTAPAIPPAISIGTVQPLRFSGQGQARSPVAAGAALPPPYTGLVADISSSKLSSKNRRCIYMAAGNVVSVCVRSGSTACPAIEPTGANACE